MAKIDVIRNKNYNFLTSTLAENEFVMVSYLSVLFKNPVTYTNQHRVVLLSVLFKNPATFTSPIGVSFLSVLFKSPATYTNQHTGVLSVSFFQKPCNI